MTEVIQIGTALTHLIAAAIGAFVGAGVTVVTAAVFVRSILNSPAALAVIEGLVNSFPAETRELINLIGQFLGVISDGVPVVDFDFSDDDEVEG